MDKQPETHTEETEGGTWSLICSCAIFSVAAAYVATKMCLEYAFRRKPKIDYYKGERTVTITAPDGSKIVAHRKERVEKGKLKEAEGGVTQYGSNQGEELWTRQWMGSTMKRLTLRVSFLCGYIIALLPMGGYQSVEERHFHGEVHVLKFEQGKITPLVELQNDIKVRNSSKEAFFKMVEGEVEEMMDKTVAAIEGLQSLSQIQSGPNQVVSNKK